MSRKYKPKAPSKQDLIAARAELKEFRHNVSLLKKKGLIKKDKYDARSIKNEGQVGKYLRSVMRQFGDVLKGEAVPVKANKQQIKQYKEKGYKVKNGRVIVPKKQNEKVLITKSGIKHTITTASGKISRLNLNFDPKNILSWRKELRKIKLKPNERIALQFNGENFYQTYSSIEQLIERFEIYEDDPDKMADVITSIAIFKVDESVDWEYNYKRKRRDAEQRLKNRTREKNRMLHMSDNQYAKYRESRARREQARRVALKSDPVAYAEYKEKARQRAAKSQAQLNKFKNK